MRHPIDDTRSATKTLAGSSRLPAARHEAVVFVSQRVVIGRCTRDPTFVQTRDPSKYVR